MRCRISPSAAITQPINPIARRSTEQATRMDNSGDQHSQPLATWPAHPFQRHGPRLVQRAQGGEPSTIPSSHHAGERAVSCASPRFGRSLLPCQGVEPLYDPALTFQPFILSNGLSFLSSPLMCQICDLAEGRWQRIISRRAIWPSSWGLAWVSCCSSS